MKDRHTMPVAAHILLEDNSGNILFLRRAGTGYADGSFSVPAGHVELGETLVQAAARELREEVGIALATDELRFCLLQHKHDLDDEERIDVFFRATLRTGQAPEIREPHACDLITWAPAAAPPDPIVPYVAAALEAVARQRHPDVAYFGFRSLP